MICENCKYAVFVVDSICQCTLGTSVYPIDDECNRFERYHVKLFSLRVGDVMLDVMHDMESDPDLCDEHCYFGPCIKCSMPKNMFCSGADNEDGIDIYYMENKK